MGGAKENKPLQRAPSGGKRLREGGQSGQELVAGGSLHDFWSGGWVQIRDQDCDLPAEPLPCHDHGSGKDTVCTPKQQPLH